MYTSTTWLEHSMTTAAKITALDNLEGMYDGAVTYTDAITHSTSYYTDAQAAAAFLPVTGLTADSVCATLDGYTADQIISAGSPSGVIGLWSGSEASIPSGWVLCNGSNGTPDLRNRFVVGAGNHYAKDATGGANTVTTTATITVAGHALTAAETPLHSHGTIVDNYEYERYQDYGPSGASSSAPPMMNAQADHLKRTGYTGSGTSHSHTASWAGTENQERRPPYYALCFIMKS